MNLLNNFLKYLSSIYQANKKTFIELLKYFLLAIHPKPSIILYTKGLVDNTITNILKSVFQKLITIGFLIYFYIAIELYLNL